MGADPEVARYWNSEIFLFPVLKELLADPAVLDHKYDFYGGQAVNQVFAEAVVPCRSVLRVRPVPGLRERPHPGRAFAPRSVATARWPTPSTACRTPSSSTRPTRATPSATLTDAGGALRAGAFRFSLIRRPEDRGRAWLAASRIRRRVGSASASARRPTSSCCPSCCSSSPSSSFRWSTLSRLSVYKTTLVGGTRFVGARQFRQGLRRSEVLGRRGDAAASSARCRSR